VASKVLFHSTQHTALRAEQTTRTKKMKISEKTNAKKARKYPIAQQINAEFAVISTKK